MPPANSMKALVKFRIPRGMLDSPSSSSLQAPANQNFCRRSSSPARQYYSLTVWFWNDTRHFQHELLVSNISQVSVSEWGRYANEIRLWPTCFVHNPQCHVQMRQCVSLKSLLVVSAHSQKCCVIFSTMSKMISVWQTDYCMLWYVTVLFLSGKLIPSPDGLTLKKRYWMSHTITCNNYIMSSARKGKRRAN